MHPFHFHMSCIASEIGMQKARPQGGRSSFAEPKVCLPLLLLLLLLCSRIT
jgi:hypothetical protein